MTALKDAALAYAKRGWPVFPCRLDKTPYTTNGVNGATTDAEQIEKWWKRWPGANIAVNVGEAGMMVLDLDPGHDIEALERNIGELPETGLRQRTPRGGVHLFFALKPDEHAAPSAGKLAQAVDVRGAASYVLLAPSKTADGSYQWEAEGKPAFRTQSMLDKANESRRAKDPLRDTWLIEPDLPEHVERAVKWLTEDAKPAVEGRAGDLATYSAAAMMHSFGLSPEKALEVLWEHYNPRCDPPWEFEDLERKVENGYSYATSAPGNMTDAYQVAKRALPFKAVEAKLPTGREVTAGRFRAVDRAGIEHIKPPEWIVPDLLMVNTYAIMFGQQSAGKTFLALDLGLSVAVGEPVWPAHRPEALWRDIRKPGPVLYAAGEGRAGYKQRVEAWEQVHHGGEPVSNFVLIDPVPRFDEGLEPFLEAAKAHHAQYQLVIIDTIGRAMQGANVNASEDAGKFSKLVDRIKLELGGTVLALGHVGHSAKDRITGSNVFLGDADTLLGVERDKRTNIVSITMTKQKDAPEWEKPRHAALREVTLTSGKTSLVPVEVREAEQPAKESRAAQDARDIAIGLMVVDGAVAAVLQAAPGKVWSTAALAAAVALRPELHGSITSKTLRQTTGPRSLVTLRETPGTKTSRCYDPVGKRWKWVA